MLVEPTLYIWVLEHHSALILLRVDVVTSQVLDSIKASVTFLLLWFYCYFQGKSPARPAISPVRARQSASKTSTIISSASSARVSIPPGISHRMLVWDHHWSACINNRWTSMQIGKSWDWMLPNYFSNLLVWYAWNPRCRFPYIQPGKLQYCFRPQILLA